MQPAQGRRARLHEGLEAKDKIIHQQRQELGEARLRSQHLCAKVIEERRRADCAQPAKAAPVAPGSGATTASSGTPAASAASTPREGREAHPGPQPLQPPAAVGSGPEARPPLRVQELEQHVQDLQAQLKDRDMRIDRLLFVLGKGALTGGPAPPTE